MFETVIRITFLSDWHIGSGLGNGPVADSILARDSHGLPYLPGRAVKGALREGAWRLGLCRKDLASMVDYIWGTASTERASNVPGRIMAGSGRLPEDISGWLLSLDADSRAIHVEDMTIVRSQTALDRNRIALPRSLRAIECGIPGLYFSSHIAIDAPELDPDWLAAYFGAVCASVRGMGGDRARGLGVCHVDGGQQTPVRLPQPLNTDLSPIGEDAQ